MLRAARVSTATSRCCTARPLSPPFNTSAHRVSGSSLYRTGRASFYLSSRWSSSPSSCARKARPNPNPSTARTAKPAAIKKGKRQKWNEKSFVTFAFYLFTFAFSLWLFACCALSVEGQVACARERVDALGDLRVVREDEDARRNRAAVSCGSDVVSHLKLDERAIAVNESDQRLPRRVGRKEFPERFVERIGDGEIRRLKLTIVINHALHFVLVKAGDATVDQLAREEEERVQEAILHGADRARLDHFVGRDAAAAIDGAPRIGMTFRA